MREKAYGQKAPEKPDLAKGQERKKVYNNFGKQAADISCPRFHCRKGGQKWKQQDRAQKRSWKKMTH